jgi:SAM-dependent methyltransferase
VETSALKPARDPTVDYKALVRDGYDRCAFAYAAARRSEAAPVHLLMDRLLPGACILDVGCGAGVPVCRELAGRFRITGVDISPVQIRLARQNVPSGEFICADIMSLRFEPGSFDAITSFYSIFHLPRQEHAELLARMHLWLRSGGEGEPGGLLMCTVGEDDEEPYTEDDFFGATMYWSNFGRQQYSQMLERLGFRILMDSTLDSGFKDMPRESHPLLLAEKIRL